MKCLLLFGLLALVPAGCGSTSHALGPDTSVRVAADLPASPSTWAAYPDFATRHSCWARNVFAGPVMRAAPSDPALRPSSPTAIVRRVMSGLGDRRYVHRIELGPPPPRVLTHLKGYFGGQRPPRDALWAYISAPLAVAAGPAHPTQAQAADSMISAWEVALVEGALRDGFCTAGGRPLVGWSVSGFAQGVSDRLQAFAQRFPNPNPAAFRGRVALIGRRYGFRVQSIRLLRPLNLAPLVVISTDRTRSAFAKDVAAIMRLLDPIASGRRTSAVTFEGFMFEARDRNGPFIRLDNAYRGETMGGEWAWNRCWYPYPHSEPATLGKQKPCPPGSTSG